MTINWTAVAAGLGLGVAFHYMNKSKRKSIDKHTTKQWTEEEKEAIRKIISEPHTPHSTSNEMNDSDRASKANYKEDTGKEPTA